MAQNHRRAAPAEPGSKEQFKQPAKQPAQPLDFTFRLLARRPYSVAELRRALERKFGAGTRVDDTIARVRQLGYVDDRKFAADFATSLAANRGFGRNRIRQELKSRLVDYGVIDPALDQAFEEHDEHQMLEQALARKLKTLRLPLSRSRLASLCQSLMRRGFRANDIMKAVRSRPELRPVAEDAEIEETEGSGNEH
jgi:regulatory protein